MSRCSVDPDQLIKAREDARAAGDRVYVEAQKLASELAEQVGLAFRGVDLSAYDHLKIEVDRDFLDSLLRGEHLNDDFLRGCK